MMHYSKTAVRTALALGTLTLLGACASTPSPLPKGAAAYEQFPAVETSESVVDYRVGPLDVLNIRVFQEPDLSFEQVTVDAGGSLQFPLIGDVPAAGMTASELSEELEQRLGARFLRDPQVAVSIVLARSQQVTVEGQVESPGVYEISGPTTLIGALARAKSPTQVAELDEIVVFRTVDGQRMGARFDLRRIRVGLDPDPQILGGDVVVVGFDSLKGGFRDILQAAPFFNVFAVLARN